MPESFLTITDPVITLTFDLLTSKSNQFIFAPTCTKFVNLVHVGAIPW